MDKPLVLRTPPGRTQYQVCIDSTCSPAILNCQVGPAMHKYDARCISDLYLMLKNHGDWMLMGSREEKKDAKEGTVEAWARSESNPIGGWYGIKKGFRGRFGMYLPPILEHLGLAEVEHNSRNNRMRALPYNHKSKK